MSVKLADEQAAVLDAAGMPFVWMLVVFLILGSTVIAGALL